MVAHLSQLAMASNFGQSKCQNPAIQNMAQVSANLDPLANFEEGLVKIMLQLFQLLSSICQNLCHFLGVLVTALESIF